MNYVKLAGTMIKCISHPPKLEYPDLFCSGEQAVFSFFVVVRQSAPMHVCDVFDSETVGEKITQYLSIM